MITQEMLDKAKKVSEKYEVPVAMTVEDIKGAAFFYDYILSGPGGGELW